MNENDVLNYIREYLDGIRNILDGFKRKFGAIDILSGWKNGVVPSSGCLDGIKESEYRFHGVGCLVRVGEIVYDFDIVDLPGFDVWKFGNYLVSRGQCRSDKEMELLNILINKLICDGRLKKVKNSIGGDVIIVDSTVSDL